MKEKRTQHTCHIPVMGTGYTIDTPLKVAHFGISSAVSIIDHRLIEKMRGHHCKENNLEFTSIAEDEEDCRAKRITAYLNLLDTLVSRNVEQLKATPFEPGTAITKYFEMLPEPSPLKKEYQEMLEASGDIMGQQQKLREQIVPGEIQVNIMTKLDKVNYSRDNEPLPSEYNDAHAALRGYANSNLESGLVLSAGMNPRLYSYMASFDDFFPDENGYLRKKIILKVSDYRSALIQGRFLAKKGLWVSEFRIESGLNCGGHAFATEGFLLGPILHEFKKNRVELGKTLFQAYAAALTAAGRNCPIEAPAINLTVQGGVGTPEEHEFLLTHYEANSVGWGSTFLLVPEVVNIDQETMDLIAREKEGAFYLSHVSPLGVPFNAVKGSSAELEKQERIKSGKPGAVCIKKHLVFNTEFTEKPICTASKQYQKLKIKELESLNLNATDHKKAYNNIVEKMCLCIGLGNSVTQNNNLETDAGIKGVTICPGPNMAYHSKVASLYEMMDHIYGRRSTLADENRPHMFLQELKIYINYLKQQIERYSNESSEAPVKYFQSFRDNLNDGIDYYKDLFSGVKENNFGITDSLLEELKVLQETLNKVGFEQMKAHNYEFQP
ncbi:MAG: hypothetical protein ACOC0R_00480 [Mariniphaga sp.]